MSLRHRGYLREAAYWRDKDVRGVAEDFYNKLVLFLKTRSSEMGCDYENGTFSIKVSRFWNHPKAHNVVVLFAPKNQQRTGWGMTGGLGRAGKFKVLVFPFLRGPADSSSLVDRLNYDIVIHEMIHLLDPGSFKGKKGSVGKKYRGGSTDVALSPVDYFNDPSEWNAYWQEGAAHVERLLRSDIFRGEGPSGKEGRARAIKIFFGDGSLGSFKRNVVKIWDKGFLDNMNKKTQRKFDKRLAQLWLALKEKGLL